MKLGKYRDFWSKVDKTSDPSGCWLWLGALNTGGWGQVKRQGFENYVHRIAYTELVGPIPEGLEIDHLCHVRNCVNPDHLEAVTQLENLRRRRPRVKSA